MRSHVLLLLTLPLLACRPAGDRADSGEAIAREAGLGDAPSGKTGRAVAKGAEGPIPANIDEGVEDTAPTYLQTFPANATANSGTSLPTTIPAPFRGRWGLVPADCTSTRGDAKGLLTIDDSRLTLFESRGSLGRVDGNSPVDSFTANYRFTGEGMEWERVITLTRTGNRLRRTEQGSGEGPVDLTYTACPPRQASR